MYPLALMIAVAAAPADSTVLEERIDLYDPVSMAYLGSEVTWFDGRGRRLRLEITDAEGALTLLFIVRHDDQGRESEAIYFESDAWSPTREVFTYGPGLKTTTYYYEQAVPSERTESVLDEAGREIRKRYYRADGSQYGEEDVLWGDDGTQAGWDFRYVGRPGGAEFRYRYLASDSTGAWTHRVRHRNSEPERLEVRTRVSASGPSHPSSLPFASGLISTSASESSPSFTEDGRTMVFARYTDAWEEKTPFFARLTSEGWAVERLDELGTIYNLAIAPDGQTIVFSRRDGSRVSLHRTSATSSGWSVPEDLGARYGISGSYPHVARNGSLTFYDDDGREGAGIYRARRSGEGFAPPEPVFLPEEGVTFDPYVRDDGVMLVTRCFDDTCEAGPRNGVWEVEVTDSTRLRKLEHLPYVWGVDVVEALGVLVFTDGDDIRAIPLRLVRD